MQTKVIGLILLVLGGIMLSYSGFNYVTKERIVDVGPIHVDAKKNNFVRFSPIVGVVLLAGGLFFLLKGKNTIR